MNDEAADEIGAGTFMCMKEDETTTSHKGRDDENAEGRNGKMTMRQCVMKKGCTEELNLPPLHNICTNMLKTVPEWIKDKNEFNIDATQLRYHPTSAPSTLNESQ